MIILLQKGGKKMDPKMKTAKTVSVKLNSYELAMLDEVKEYWDQANEEPLSISQIIRWCIQIEYQREHGIQLRILNANEVQ